MSLLATARLAIVWTSLSRVGIQALQLLTFIVAARWLTPIEYGTFAIVALVTTFATLLNDFGLQAALIHEEAPSPSRLSTAFSMNIAVGVLFSTIVALVAYPAQSLLEYPDLAIALIVCGSAFALSVTVVPSAILQRALQLGRLAAVEFGCSLFGCLVSVILAANGFGVVSLSVGPVASALTMTVALTVMTRYVPTAKPTVADARSLWGFSGYLLGVNSTYYIFRNVDTIALTALAGPAQVGLYSRAYAIVSAPVTQAGAVISRVLFPILARTQDDPDSFRERWLRTSYASFGLCLPVAITVGVTSPYIVRMLFQPEWWPVAAIMTALSVAVPMRLLCNTIGPVFQATGHTGALFHVTIGQGAATVAGVLIGTFWGPIGVAWGVAIASTIGSYLPLSVGLRFMNMSIINMLGEFKWILLAGAAQLLAMSSVRMWDGFGSEGVSLAACLTLGTATYAAASFSLDRRFLRRITGRT